MTRLDKKKVDKQCARPQLDSRMLQLLSSKYIVHHIHWNPGPDSHRTHVIQPLRTRLCYGWRFYRLRLFERINDFRSLGLFRKLLVKCDSPWVMWSGWPWNFFRSPNVVPANASSSSTLFLGFRTLALYTSSDNIGVGWLRPPLGFGSEYLHHTPVNKLTSSSERWLDTSKAGTGMIKICNI